VPSMLRVSALRERLRASLWFLPTGFVILAVVGGTALAHIRPQPGTLLEEVVFGGSAEGARSLLELVAGAMMTVTALTFSLTVVALQMSAGQYSPRVLRNFLSDLGNKLVLSVFLATFAYCLAVLRVIRDGAAGEEVVVPSVAVTGGVLLSLVAIGTLVYFIHHLTQQLRVESIVREIVSDTLATIDDIHPDPLDSPSVAAEPLPDPDAVRVLARRSGFLQAVELEGLVGKAAAHDVLVRLRPAVGAFVVAGTTLAWVWARAGGPPRLDDDRATMRMVHDHVHIGAERTLQQDVAFGVRQLADVAAKALSTGMNDPTTAVDTIGHMSVVACRLAARQLGSRIAVDDDGVARAVLPRPDLGQHLAAMCAQPRRYGAEEPAVLLALLRLLTDVAEQAVDDEQVAAVETQVARTLEIGARSLDETDMTRLAAAADLVRRTLASERRPAPSDLDT
jgi:uncharacterized membrane protein